MFVFLIIADNSTAMCLVLSLEFSSYYNINLLLVAVNVNLAKIMISHTKHLHCKKVQPIKIESYSEVNA